MRHIDSFALLGVILHSSIELRPMFSYVEFVIIACVLCVCWNFDALFCTSSANSDCAELRTL